MDASEYDRLRAGRRRWTPRTLGEAAPRADRALSPAAAVVARAARDWRRRADGVAAWQRLAAPAWLERTAVDRVYGDVLLVAVADAELAFALRRQQATLERRLRALVRGVRQLRFVVAAAPAAE